MTAVEPQDSGNSTDVRDAFTIHAFLQRLGSKNTYNEVKEAVSSSPRADVMDWSSDAVNGFGFICNSGKAKVSDLSPTLCPSLLLGKEGDLAILEDVRAEQFIIFDGKTRKKRKLTKKEFKEWYSGKLLFAQPALEEHKTVKSRLKALSPLKTLGTTRFSWIAVAALLSNILGLATSLFVMVVYDRVLPNQATQSLYALAIGVGVAILFDTLLKGARSRIVERASVTADIAVNEDIFEQFIEVSNTKDRKSVGELASVMRDFEVYRDFMSSATILTLIDLPFVLVFVLVIYMIGGPLFIVPPDMYSSHLNSYTRRSAITCAQFCCCFCVCTITPESSCGSFRWFGCFKGQWSLCSDEKEVPDAIKFLWQRHLIKQKPMHKLMGIRSLLSNKYPKLRLLFMGSTSLLTKSLQWGLSLRRLSYLVAPLVHLQRSGKHLGAQTLLM